MICTVLKQHYELSAHVYFSLKKISKIRTSVNNSKGEDNPLLYLLIVFNPNIFGMKTHNISEMMIVIVSLPWLHQIWFTFRYNKFGQKIVKVILKHMIDDE